jgi:hypothetical protein
MGFFLIFNRLFRGHLRATMIVHHIPSRTLVGATPLAGTWECRWEFIAETPLPGVSLCLNRYKVALLITGATQTCRLNPFAPAMA